MVLSKLDLKSGFHQIPLAESSRDYSTFVNPWGKYHFTVMPFRFKKQLTCGISNETLSKSNSFAFVHIDDIWILPKSVDQHLVHIRETLLALRRAGLKVKPHMCQWGMQSLELGH